MSITINIGNGTDTIALVDDGSDPTTFPFVEVFYDEPGDYAVSLTWATDSDSGGTHCGTINIWEFAEP